MMKTGGNLIRGPFCVTWDGNLSNILQSFLGEENPAISLNPVSFVEPFHPLCDVDAPCFDTLGCLEQGPDVFKVPRIFDVAPPTQRRQIVGCV